MLDFQVVTARQRRETERAIQDFSCILAEQRKAFLETINKKDAEISSQKNLIEDLKKQIGKRDVQIEHILSVCASLSIDPRSLKL